MRYVGFGVGHIDPSVRADPSWPTNGELEALDLLAVVEGEEIDDDPNPGDDAEAIASETEEGPVEDMAGNSDRESVSADL